MEVSRLGPCFYVDRLRVCVHTTATDMGRVVADEIAQRLRQALSTRVSVRVAFAAAASQAIFLEYLTQQGGIDWRRLEAVHLDEYVGIAPDHPSSFRRWLADHVFDKVPIGRVEYLDGVAEDAAQECARYEAILNERPVDFGFLGIGENGHLGFNDPHAADFHDSRLVKIVDLDETSRAQQVRDGAFPSIDCVPTRALTLTIPAIMCSRSLSTVVSGANKAGAIERTLVGPVSSECPASILRLHPSASLHVDEGAFHLARTRLGAGVVPVRREADQ